jgi:hypothetical protein
MAEQMARGTPVIYCNLVDYDEVAHHAGPARPESMRQLESLDRMLGVLERLAPEAARHYHLVVVSDHGHSQGATFRQRWGETLVEVVERLAAPGVPVVSSGNLSLVYVPDTVGQQTLEQIEQAYPELVRGLAAHPGIGLVVVTTEDEGPVVFGTAGRHRLRDGLVRGEDPLTPYGPHAAADLLRHQNTAHVGDLVLISAVDPRTEEVAAFEELVGSHGGMGGWQTDAMLVHPADWPRIADELNGSDAVHRQLIAWLVMLGLRATPPALAPSPPITDVIDESRLTASHDR